MAMDGKKDPGKFIIRFNLADPQQRRAAELVNRQGRSKAQFIANAVLCYADGQASAPQGALPVDSGQVRQLVEEILSQRLNLPREEPLPAPMGSASMDNDALKDTERSLIFKTLEAFQKQ